MAATEPDRPRSTSDAPRPDASLVIPCYNEEASIRPTAEALARAFRQRGVDLELVLVDNGSADGTQEVIRKLADEGLPVTLEVVEVNRGYGYGVLRGLAVARGRYLGFLCADNQVDADDVVRVYSLAASGSPKLVKVRRRFRMDGLRRKLVSVVYNLVANALFGGLHSIDVNGNPKILPREDVERMQLVSEDWFLDAEVMIKAKQLGLRVLELNVLARMREEGASHVRAGTVVEFAKNLLRCRFGGAPSVRSVSAPQAADRGAERR